MRDRLLVVLLIVALLTAETPIAAAQTAADAAAAPAAAAQLIVLPAGTAIPLTLVTPIKSKSTKPGDAVRAEVAFPVTSGTQLAIPAGAYVEGTIIQVTARPSRNGQPEVRIHFTLLLFPNGYSAPLDAANTQAEVIAPLTSAPPTERADGSSTPAADRGLSSFAFSGQQPQPPSLPREGPSPAVIGGAVAGGFVAFIAAALLWAHHRRNNLDYVLFDAGWQFQMVLASPLTLDSAKMAAAAGPGVQ
ncbi:MAG: hypothetical protein ACRD3N_04090 [Terracidiphilus sp.]